MYVYVCCIFDVMWRDWIQSDLISHSIRNLQVFILIHAFHMNRILKDWFQFSVPYLNATATCEQFTGNWFIPWRDHPTIANDMHVKHNEQHTNDSENKTEQSVQRAHQPMELCRILGKKGRYYMQQEIRMQIILNCFLFVIIIIFSQLFY